jgi:hypothetical protein
MTILFRILKFMTGDFMKIKFIFIPFVLLFFLLNGVCLGKSAKTPEEFLKNYGWTAKYKTEFSATIPKKFIHNAGEYPIALYWAFNNELSKKIGLDISSFRGKNVVVKFYEVDENMPQECAPFTKGAAVIVMYKNKKIIGGWISAVNSACSLDKKYVNFQNICGQDFNEWIVKNKIIYVKNDIDQSLSKLEPKDVIGKFIENLNNKDYRRAFSCFGLRYLLNMLFFDIETKAELKNDFTYIFLGELYRIEKVNIKNIKDISGKDEYKVFEVETDIQYKNAGVMNKKWIFVLKKEIPELGYRIIEVRK